MPAVDFAVDGERHSLRIAADSSVAPGFGGTTLASPPPTSVAVSRSAARPVHERPTKPAALETDVGSFRADLVVKRHGRGGARGPAPSCAQPPADVPALAAAPSCMAAAGGSRPARCVHGVFTAGP
jgi:hypothetical protein